MPQSTFTMVLQSLRNSTPVVFALGLTSSGLAPGQDSQSPATSPRFAEVAVDQETFPVIDADQLRELVVSPDVEHAQQAQFVARRQQVERRRPQFARLLAGELEVVAVACNPTPEQQDQLTDFFDAWIEPALERFANALAGPLEIRVDEGLQDQTSGASPRDPQQIVVAAVEEACQTFLTPEQVGRYRRELERRQAHRREAAIQNMIVSLDAHLLFTPEQRAELTSLLTSQWQDAWADALPTFIHAGEFFPAMPLRVVEQALTREQRLAFRRVAAGWPRASGDEAIRDDSPLDDADQPEGP